MVRARVVVTAVLAALVVGYVGYGALLFALQDTMIFPAPGGVGVDQLDAVAAETGARPFRITTDDGVELYGWHRSTGADKVVLYLHGNGETVAGNIGLQRLVTREGWDFVTFAYRGYPGSEGHPSEAGLTLDARAVWRHLTETLGFAPDRVVLHGRSLGGGVAAILAEEHNPSAMVLESTFTSITRLARRQAPLYPVSLLLAHRFETAARAPRVGVPTLVLHSRDDQVIPVQHGRDLHPRFAESTYLETAGYGHEHCLPVSDPEIRAAYLTFLRDAVGD